MIWLWVMSTKEDNKRTGEMLDRYRNEGTLGNVLMIDRENLDLRIANDINKGMIEILEKAIKDDITIEILLDNLKTVKYGVES